MKYIFYIDQETVSCDSTTIESLIKDNCNSYLQVNSSLWALDIDKDRFITSFLAPEKYYIDILFDEYLNDFSICFMLDANSKHCNYSLPDSAIQFIYEDVE
nr:hypothetical protein [uncultured Anaerostipes sp.]